MGHFTSRFGRIIPQGRVDDFARICVGVSFFGRSIMKCMTERDQGVQDKNRTTKLVFLRIEKRKIWGE